MSVGSAVLPRVQGLSLEFFKISQTFLERVWGLHIRDFQFFGLFWAEVSPASPSKGGSLAAAGPPSGYITFLFTTWGTRFSGVAAFGAVCRGLARVPAGTSTEL